MRAWPIMFTRTRICRLMEDGAYTVHRETIQMHTPSDLLAWPPLSLPLSLIYRTDELRIGTDLNSDVGTGSQ